MTDAQMLPIILAITQFAKEFLRKWINIEGFLSRVLVTLVTAAVVGYKYITEGMPFDVGSFIGKVVALSALAMGGKSFLSSIAGKVAKALVK